MLLGKKFLDDIDSSLLQAEAAQKVIKGGSPAMTSQPTPEMSSMASIDALMGPPNLQQQQGDSSGIMSLLKMFTGLGG